MGGSASAQQMLDERYARGEIDEIEYLHRRAVLRGS
jgi:putative membrane protein